MPSRPEALRRALFLTLALAVLAGSGPAHDWLHGEPLRAAADGSQLHGDDCDHGAELEHPSDDAHCLLCGSARLHAVAAASTVTARLAPAASARAADRAAADAPAPAWRAGPPGARAPPREA